MNADSDSRRGLLDGVKIVDFTRYLAGPFATALLADLGADIIKVESPEGDHYREIGIRPDGHADSVLFLAANRGKRSIALDLRDPHDLNLARALVARADVLFENFRPGVMDALGLGWNAARALNLRLIFVSVSGFGQTGPESHKPAYDTIIQALSGFMATNGEADRSPMLAGEALADVSASVFASWGALAALYARERTGEGTYVDVSLLGSLMTLIPTSAATFLIAGKVVPRTGNKHPVSAPFGVYRCKDGQFAVAVITQRQFRAVLRAMDRLDLDGDPRFASDALRRQHEGALAELIESWSATLSAAEVVRRLEAAEVAASRVLDVPHAWQATLSSGCEPASWVSRPGSPPVLVPEQPVRFLGARRGARRPAPLLDEHKAEILREIGWNP